MRDSARIVHYRRWLWCGGGAAVVLVAAWWLISSGQDRPRPPLEGFHLVDHRHQIFDAQRLRGGWNVLSFGFTSCPDVCPATLHSLARTVERMKSENVKPPRVFFVSVDPQRDTLTRLAEYVPYFNASFVGVTGSQEQIRALERQLGANHRVHAPGGGATRYNVDHSAMLYVIDPLGRPVDRLSPPFDPPVLAEELMALKGAAG